MSALRRRLRATTLTATRTPALVADGFLSSFARALVRPPPFGTDDGGWLPGRVEVRPTQPPRLPPRAATFSERSRVAGAYSRDSFTRLPCPPRVDARA
jgi:hypothetical protein